MHRAWYKTFALSVLFATLLMCASCTQTSPPEVSDTESTQIPYVGQGVPAELEQYADNPNAAYMTMILAQIPGTPLKQSTRTERDIFEFAYNGGEIIANVIMENGLRGVTETGFSILCDGIPIPYTLMESGETMLHCPVSLEGQMVYKVAFTPSFSAGIGRIDFVQTNAANMYNLTYHLGSYSILAILPDDYQAADTAMRTDKHIVATRENLKEAVSGAMVDMCIVGADSGYEKGGLSAAGSLHVANVSSWVFEMLFGAPGTYRVTAFLDYEPYPFFDGHSTIECQIGENQMLMMEKAAAESFPVGTHSFYVVASKIDEDALTSEPMESRRMEIVNN